MSWKLSKVTSPVSDELVNFVEKASILSEKVSAVLNNATGLLDIVSILFSTKTDPMAATMVTIVELLKAFLNDMFGTGIYSLVVSPLHLEDQFNGMSEVKKVIVDRLFEDSVPENLTTEGGIPVLTPYKAIEHAIESFDDFWDKNRPQFSELAQVSAYGIMVTAPTKEVFIELLELLSVVFSIPDFDLLLRKLEIIGDDDGVSTNPDWQSLKLNSFEPLGEIQKAVDEFLQLASGYLLPKNSAVEDLIDTIIDKVNELNSAIELLSDLISRLKKVAEATGIWVFNYGPQVGGTFSIQEALYDPVFYTMDDNKFTVLSLFVGGGASLEPVELIKQLL
jgi:hypothetical protein